MSEIILSIGAARALHLAAQGLLAHIRSHGPVRSSDFERSGGKADAKAGSWWEWKPEKRSLEVSFTCGALMIARRHNFQRVYDLAERVHPEWDDERMPSPAQVQQSFALRAVKALGLARAEPAAPAGCLAALLAGEAALDGA